MVVVVCHNGELTAITVCIGGSNIEVMPRATAPPFRAIMLAHPILHLLLGCRRGGDVAARHADAFNFAKLSKCMVPEFHVR
jgi:hypothetical protein